MPARQGLGAPLVAGQSVAWRATGHVASSLVWAFPDTWLTARSTGFAALETTLEMCTRNLTVLLAWRTGLSLVAI